MTATKQHIGPPPRVYLIDDAPVITFLLVDLPIIFISSYAEVSAVVRALRGGALDFLQKQKPFSTQPLLDRVQDRLRIGEQRARTQERSREIGERMSLLTPREREGARRRV